ncbi:hypothetical protein [Pseudomonas fluorescens]|uniref:hypothetical protein n=1 Tax=Pseudomonas fluorescens TaxID=294 RepID=UPI002B1D4314|nr:hypothetical protein [Pseudomonas fluorescens]
MNAFSERVSANVLPYSISKSLPDALKEWSVTDVMKDHEHATETCELCDHEALRYQYEIVNVFTRNTLWVGSSCILRFGVSVLENGVVLSKKSAERKLDRLLQSTRQATCIRSLERLAKAESDERLVSALNYYRKNACLTPKFAVMVLWRLGVAKIDHSPTFFKISLRRDLHKQHLREMKLGSVHLIWPALTSAQRATAIAMGHCPPPPPLPALPVPSFPLPPLPKLPPLPQS